MKRVGGLQPSVFSRQASKQQSVCVFACVCGFIDLSLSGVAVNWFGCRERDQAPTAVCLSVSDI